MNAAATPAIGNVTNDMMCYAGRVISCPTQKGGVGLARSLKLVDIGPLRSSRSFRLLWTGQLMSSLGSQLTVVAVPFQVYQLTRSSLMVGLVSLGQLVPLVLCSLLGGSFADAFDRRRILLRTQFILGLCSAGLAVNAFVSESSLSAIFVLSALSAGISGFDSPARRAAITGMVDRQQLTAAFALNQIMANTTSLIGPATAGVIIAFAGLQTAFLIDAVTFALSMAAVLRLPPLPTLNPTKVGFASISQGLQYVRSNPVVQATFLADLSAMAFGTPRALFPALGIGFFHGGPTTVGLLYAAPGAGAFIAAATSGWVASVRRQGAAVICAVSVWGAAIVAFGLVPWLPAALLLLATAGAADVVSAVFRSTIVQLSAPDNLRGRLAAIHVAVVTGGPRIGDARAGAMASIGGTQFSLVSGGIACLLGTAALMKYRPQLASWTLDDAVDEAVDDAVLRVPVPQVLDDEESAT
jgi:predicted MFS family arabinose efflux permease